jgi:hypothetical protein
MRLFNEGANVMRFLFRNKANLKMLLLKAAQQPTLHSLALLAERP